jgi:hypothetical protein
MKSGFYGSISCPILIKDDTLNCRGSMPWNTFWISRIWYEIVMAFKILSWHLTGETEVDCEESLDN